MDVVFKYIITFSELDLPRLTLSNTIFLSKSFFFFISFGGLHMYLVLEMLAK